MGRVRVRDAGVYRGGTGRVPNGRCLVSKRSRSLSRRDRQGSQLIRALLPLWRESIEEGPAGFPTLSVAGDDEGGVYRGGTGRVPNGPTSTSHVRRSLSRRDRQGSQRVAGGYRRPPESIEEGPAGFPTCEPGTWTSSGVYRGGTGRVPNVPSTRARRWGSLSRRDRQGSQPFRCGVAVSTESIEEGPAGFPTVAGTGAQRVGVYRGGTGRVPNLCSKGRSVFWSLSRRDRQGSQLDAAACALLWESIEEGPAGFPTGGGVVGGESGVYRGGAGRVPNAGAGCVNAVRSLSRRDRQGSQPDSAFGAVRRESIEEGPAGFPTTLTT